MRKRKWLIVLILLLVAVRLALPQVIKYKANQTLGTLPEYTGHVDGVSLSLLRGAIQLEDLKIKHKKNDFALTIQEFDCDLSWSDLIKKKIVADIYVQSPTMRVLVPKPTEAAKEVKEKGKAAEEAIEKKTGKSLPDLLAEMVPFNVRDFHIKDGTIRIQQEAGKNVDAQAEKDKDADQAQSKGREDPLEARVTDLNVDVKDLSNDPKLAGTATAKGTASANVMKDGKFRMDLKLTPTAKNPTFDINMALTRVNLVELNPLLRWQWDIDLTKGQFAMFMEAAARDGRFKGYIKPFLHDLKVTGSKRDEDKKLGAKIKEVVVETVANIMENEKNENIAARVPFEGKFDNPDVGIWEAILTVLRNAFIRALKPQLDRSISLSTWEKRFLKEA